MLRNQRRILNALRLLHKENIILFRAMVDPKVADDIEQRLELLWHEVMHE